MHIKGGNFIESHIEKLVLAGIGIVCIYLLISYVLVSPNKVSLGSRKYDPGEIDKVISEKAESLSVRLNRDPEKKEEYHPKSDAFVAMLEGRKKGMEKPFDERFPAVAKNYLPYAIGNIVSNYTLPLPPEISEEQTIDRKYALPETGGVSDVTAEHIRAAAYVPVSSVTLNNKYQQSKSEISDIDVVTVSARFNVPDLVNEFHSCFDSPSMPVEWRDPCLARPVFAAVELQRREKLGESDWSSWESVPRVKVDPYKEKIKLKGSAQELGPGGVKMWLLQFDDEQLRRFLLQPPPYEIASAEEEWFPPSIHREFLEYRRDVERKERMEAREKEKEERERKREEREDRYDSSRNRTRRPGERNLGRYDRDRRRPERGLTRGRYDRSRGGRYDSRYERGSYDRGARRGEEEKAEEKKPEKTLDDFYEKLESVVLPAGKDVTKIEEPILFWSHDDTVEPGKAYQYRIRLGVFNPVAGTDQIKQEYKSRSDQVILWSDFSGHTDTVEIPKRMYFFPTNIQEAAKRVSVKVSKYELGYWYSEDFAVRPGELIGEAVEIENVTDKKQEERGTGQKSLPDMIDYSTGAFFVDISLVNSWAKSGVSLAKSYYQEMLYSYDGINIEHMPIKYQNWSNELQNVFVEIQQAEKKEKKPFREWGGKSQYIVKASRRSARAEGGVRSRR